MSRFLRSGRLGHRLGAFRTPRTMRLERDLAELQAMRNESTILDFKTAGDSAATPEKYLISYHGSTLVPSGKDGAKLSEKPQQVEVSLSGSYPRSQPAIAWKTTILHPNIFGGHVCLGNFHNQWSPNVRLADLVEILWDMARLAILNPYSAGGGASNAYEHWSKLRNEFGFPVDKRPLRDKILGTDSGSSIIRPDSPQDEVIILDDDEGACQK